MFVQDSAPAAAVNHSGGSRKDVEILTACRIGAPYAGTVLELKRPDKSERQPSAERDDSRPGSATLRQLNVGLGYVSSRHALSGCVRIDRRRSIDQLRRPGQATAPAASAGVARPFAKADLVIPLKPDATKKGTRTDVVRALRSFVAFVVKTSEDCSRSIRGLRVVRSVMEADRRQEDLTWIAAFAHYEFPA